MNQTTVGEGFGPPAPARVLVAESSNFPATAMESLRRIGCVELAELDRRQLLASVEMADVLWVRLRNRIDADVLAAAPHLKMIATPTTGLNHVDLDEALARGVEVVSLRGEAEFLKDVRATAEHTLGLMLALLRNVPSASEHVRSGGWNRDALQGSDLHGKTVGIVGFGRLGRLVARYLAPFEVHVLATDRDGVEDLSAVAAEANATLVPLAELLSAADIVTLHANYLPENARFFGRSALAAMKPGAWLINTARGELVDDRALIEALDSGRLAGAALDVLSNESSLGMGEHPLVTYARSHRNVLITPHIGGCTRESQEKTEVFLAEKVFRTWRKLPVSAR